MIVFQDDESETIGVEYGIFEFGHPPPDPN